MGKKILMKTIVQRDSVKGRGVYAKELILAGEVIEICELLLMEHSEVQNSLEGYVYEYSSTKAAVALGNGSLFNHCDRSNSEFYFNYRKKHLLIKARKRIRPGEEVTINYGYDKSLKKKFNIM